MDEFLRWHKRLLVIDANDKSKHNTVDWQQKM